jgi:hypothetical protein
MQKKWAAHQPDQRFLTPLLASVLALGHLLHPSMPSAAGRQAIVRRVQKLVKFDAPTDSQLKQNLSLDDSLIEPE